MSAAARTESLEQRTAIFNRLALRNRLVAILRIGVPAIGAIVFVALLAQIYIGNLLEQFGVSGVRVDRNNLIVETPSYTSAGPDGTLYTMGAVTARSSFDQPDMLMLTGITLDVLPTGNGGTYHANAQEASLATGTRQLVIPGTTTIVSEDGLSGTIMDLEADLARRNLVAGATSMTFPDGSVFTAQSANFSSKGRVWTFTGVTMRLIDTPQAVTP